MRCAQTHDLVVIDSTAALLDATLAFLDQSDVVLTVLTLEITNIKNMRQFLALVEQLGFSESKIQLVLNRADSAYGIRFQDVESSIGRKINHTVVSDGRTVVFALNRGVPFVVASRQSQGQPRTSCAWPSRSLGPTLRRRPRRRRCDRRPRRASSNGARTE